MFGFGKKKVVEAPQPKRAGGLFSTEAGEFRLAYKGALELPRPEVPKVTVAVEGVGMDDATGDSVKFASLTQPYGVPEAQIEWYASQGFIGYQLCAILAQHWLIDKACSMPGRDAVRNGYELNIDGTDIDPKMLRVIKRADKRMAIKWHLQEYMRKGRIFGIRHAMFYVVSNDPKYYEKPFNIDGITPNSYKGIVQIDPYWITPELTSGNLVDPTSLHFYEPEYWRVGGKLVHRSHLCIYTTGSMPDILKPGYFYGGVSVPQRIYERVYAAERTANEAPMLAMTKRLTVMMADLTQAVADPVAFETRMAWWIQNRDNYGVKFLGLDEKIMQLDISLADLDNVIMTQYQIAAAIAEVPGTKLLGTQPKGFNSTGEFEESSYHETLESIEENDLTPLLDRHYELLCRSEIEPLFPEAGKISLELSWNELDAMTAQEQAQVNATLAATGAALIVSGAIESQDERTRVANDPDSGYSFIDPEMPPMPDNPDPSAAPGAPPTGTKAGAATVAAALPKPGKPHPEAGA